MNTAQNIEKTSPKLYKGMPSLNPSGRLIEIKKEFLMGKYQSTPQPPQVNNPVRNQPTGLYMSQSKEKLPAPEYTQS